jgi:hypothetical protein
VVGAAVALTAGTVASGSAATGEVVLSYPFEPTPTATSTTVFGNDGDGSVTTTAVRAYGGTLSSVASVPGQGDALRFPTFDPSSTGARAVVEVRNSTSTDVLAPGYRDFSWSIAFKVDATSAVHSSTSHDDGDNMFQRGLYSTVQYKLDVDAHRPGCRIRGTTGSAGAVKVVAPVTVSPDRWYRATCTRTGSKLTVTVDAYGSDGQITQTWTRSATSSVGFGSLTWKNKATPVAIGGKLTSTGTFPSGSVDQFNGVLDNPTLTYSTP